MSRIAFDAGRRNLLRLRRPEAAAPPRPPWLVAAGLAEQCSRCGDCATACPERIVILGDGGYPELDFALGGCSFCRACARACPAPGLFAPVQAPPWRLTAMLGDGCLARRGVTCQSCAEACPEGAIRFRPVLHRPPQPTVDAAACTGCGACVGRCPVGALSIAEAADG